MSDAYPKIRSVEAAQGLTLRLDFGRHGIRDVDLTELATGKKAALADGNVFATAALGEYGSSVVWPAIGLEVGADALWRVSQRQEGQAMRPEEFKAWRKRLGLTQAGVAQAMGITRRAVIYYEQGARLIPRLVTLACKALEAEKSEIKAA